MTKDAQRPRHTSIVSIRSVERSSIKSDYLETLLDLHEISYEGVIRSLSLVFSFRILKSDWLFLETLSQEWSYEARKSIG